MTAPSGTLPIRKSWLQLKQAGTPIVMITAYDVVSGRVAEAAGVDVVLVGDSGGTVVLGYPSTRDVSVEELIVLGAPCAARCTRPCWCAISHSGPTRNR